MINPQLKRILDNFLMDRDQEVMCLLEQQSKGYKNKKKGSRSPREYGNAALNTLHL